MKQPIVKEGDKITIAVVGCGKISQNHFSAIQHHKENFQLVEVCDLNVKNLENCVVDPSVKKFSDFDEFVEKSKAQVVVLCTPSGLHAQQTIALANAGKHIITEKPMATSWEDGLAMVEACEKNHVKLFVVKQVRFNPALQHLKNALKNKRFGKLYMVNLNVFWCRPQSYYDQAPWRGTRLMDGGALMNQASHHIDLLEWLFGPVDSVHAMMGTLARNIEMEDTSVANIRWKCGAMGSLNVTMLTYPNNLETSLTVLGEKGTVKISGGALNHIQHWEFEGITEEEKTAVKKDYLQDLIDGKGHVTYYGNIADNLLGKTKEVVDGEEGLKSLALLTALYQSAATHQAIRLAPLFVEESVYANDNP